MTLLTGSANCIKYVLFAFNFAFVITGIILISVGVTVAAVYNDYSIFLTSNFFSIPTLLIVTGVFIFLIAFFGCCGAIKENYCMILSFSVMLGFIFILELSGGISGYVLRNDAKSLIETNIEETMKNYNKTTHPDVVKVWDGVQSNFQCCGVHNVTDWIKAINAVPMSCCSPELGAVNSSKCPPDDDSKHLYPTGCLDAFGDFVSGHAVSLGAAGIVIAIVQFIGIFFACYIAREIKTKTGASGPF